MILNYTVATLKMTPNAETNGQKWESLIGDG